MTVENIQQQIKFLKQRMYSWPDERIKIIDDRSQVLALTDTHFSASEADLQKLLERCKTLPTNDQNAISPHLKELQVFVKAKFLHAEKELIEIKGRMGQGRHHIKAIRVYTKS